MLHRLLGGTALLWMLSAWTGAAEQAPKAVSAAATPRQRMAEDVEVLRRILNRTLESQLTEETTGRLHWRFADASPSATKYLWKMQDGPAAMTAYPLSPDSQKPSNPRPDAEGSYLKGHGVVYTLTLPAERFRAPKSEPAKGESKPLSDWERTRKEVRGEKLGPDERATERREPTLREMILKVLAENGQHLEQLADGEAVTVIVTLRGGFSTAPDLAESQDLMHRAMLDILGQIPTDIPLPKANTPEERSRAIDALLRQKAGDTAEATNDYVLLGDLHMKQNRYAEAAKAYTTALQTARTAKDSSDIYRKVAQAELAKGDLKAAEAALANARQLLEAPPKTAAPPTPREPLPAKVIVSASKRLLDQVGSGKMTFEEFQKAATVEFQTFNEAPKTGKQP
ncbi:MAG: hypothetical protein JNM56_21495 [Planctomycetia bacterium]|nr:hypothetical protein [Planctomycetia bacterium]